MSAPRAELLGYAVSGYKAYAREARVDLGRITVLLGRNNAGKSALAFAPIFLSQALRPDARSPFDLLYSGIDFGRNLLDVCYARQLSGLRGRLFLNTADGITDVVLGATAAPEQAYRQIVTELGVLGPHGPIETATHIEWDAARRRLATYPVLATLPDSIGVLLAERPRFERSIRLSGAAEPTIGPHGEGAFELLAQSKAGTRAELLHAVNEWLVDLDLAVDVASQEGSFEIRMNRPKAPADRSVHLNDTGSGVAQLLPLIVALSLPRDTPTPALLLVEQPELHLHPRAHARVAELFISALMRSPERRFLVETHSDTFVLRLRREVAAGRLAPADVRLYFVDEGDGLSGSIVKEIRLDERGTPRWWPKGVFAEPQAEYYAIRRALSQRDAKSPRTES